MSDRTTPFATIFGSTGLAAEHFPRIAAALEAGGDVTPDRDRFLTLAPVGDLLAEIAPASGEGAAQIALLTFHAYHHWREGGHDREIEPATLPTLITLPPIGAWLLQPPARAGYVLLPRHQLWVAGHAGQAAEPVDGFFWVTGPPANALDLLLVLGLHEGRAGVTVIELASGPLPDDGHWGDLQVRAEGVDFANVLPGGERLFGLTNAAEALKLVSRVFWHLGHG